MVWVSIICLAVALASAVDLLSTLTKRQLLQFSLIMIGLAINDLLLPHI